MNLPNRLSLFRVAVIPVFMPLLWIEELLPAEDHLMLGLAHVASLLLVITVAVSDYYDGAVARRMNLVSNTGKLLDPLADKIFMMAALIGLSVLGLLPYWITIVILAREFLITGLRSIAADRGRIIAADRMGKHKTGWQFGLLITAIVFMGAEQFLRLGGVWPEPLVSTYHLDDIFYWVLWIPITVTLVLTLWSGWGYMRKHGDLLD